MYFKWSKRHKLIVSVIGSSLCTVLWLYLTVRYMISDRSFLLPLIATVIFAVCAAAEIKQYLKYRAFQQQKKAASAPKDEAAK